MGPPLQTAGGWGIPVKNMQCYQLEISPQRGSKINRYCLTPFETNTQLKCSSNYALQSHPLSWQQGWQQGWLNRSTFSASATRSEVQMVAMSLAWPDATSPFWECLGVLWVQKEMTDMTGWWSDGRTVSSFQESKALQLNYIYCLKRSQKIQHCFSWHPSPNHAETLEKPQSSPRGTWSDSTTWLPGTRIVVGVFPRKEEHGRR